MTRPRTYRRPSAGRIRRGLVHARYEIEMFVAGARTIVSWPPGQPPTPQEGAARNHVIESCLVHIRPLMYFFRADRAHSAISARVVHLSYLRARPFPGWTMGDFQMVARRLRDWLPLLSARRRRQFAQVEVWLDDVIWFGAR